MTAIQRNDRWVLATHNAGKVREFAELLAPLSISMDTAGSLGLDEPEETGSSFEANALLKARAACDASGRIALADDSGLCVKALDDAPGIYSARWAGEQKDFAHAMARIDAELAARKLATTGSAAYFVCVLAVAMPDGTAELFRGEVHGTLIYPPRGTRGFGYDPMFIADGHALSFGEMEPEHKHAISHRAAAMARFRQWLASTHTRVAS